MATCSRSFRLLIVRRPRLDRRETGNEFMKILLFVENNHSGGMDSFFEHLINHWPYPEDELCLICNEDHPGLPNIRSAASRPCDFIAHGIPLNWSVADRLLGFLPATFRRLARAVLRVALFPYQLYRLRSMFRKLRGDRLMVVNGAYPGGESCRLANIAWQQTGGPLSIHNIRNFAIPPRPALAWYENWIDRRLESSVRAYIGVSRCCAESLRLRPSLLNSDKIFHIYNGVAMPPKGEREHVAVDLRKRLGISDGMLCLMLATYESRKGHAFLFDAFRLVNERFPKTHLVICGDGTAAERAQVEELRQRHVNRAQIHLLEFIPGGSKLIWQADLLVVASQEWESFGWTVIESMVRGVPVVSTIVGGLAEVVGPDGVAGFAVDPNDVPRFAAAMCELIASEPRRVEMGSAGRRRVAEMFTVDRMVREYARLIRHPVASDPIEVNR